MLPSDFQTYCLGCHKLMPVPSSVCPRCGADQDALRELLSRPPVPAHGRHAPPPRPLNAVADAPCPTCHVRVPAGAPSCLYCGHPMLTDLPEWKTDAQDARPYAIGALACCALGLAGFCLFLVWPGFATIAMVLMMVALVLAALAHGENPLGWSGVSLIGLVIGSMLAGFGILAAGIMIARGVGG
jgi:RNA polymerase subunit RPABC4/transcription elongation factor Spt4